LFRGDDQVLTDVSVAFERGTCNVVVGPSGAGKTSLLRCLNGLDRPRGGRVYLEGSDVTELPPTELRRRVGMIFQIPVLFSGSVEDNLLYEVEAGPEAISTALEQAGLDGGFVDRPAGALSTGQAQRVCIARALIRGPEVLLMDEPTSALDRDAAARVEDTVAALTDSGLTVIFVTHNLEQAQRLGARAVLFAGGTVRYQGPVDRLEEVWKEHSS
jgi:putative ABC transport system ATP-binding protein